MYLWKTRNLLWRKCSSGSDLALEGGGGLPLMQRSPPVTQVTSGKCAPGWGAIPFGHRVAGMNWVEGWSLTPGGKKLEFRVFSKGLLLRGVWLKTTPSDINLMWFLGEEIFILKFSLGIQRQLETEVFFFLHQEISSSPAFEQLIVAFSASLMYDIPS